MPVFSKQRAVTKTVWIVGVVVTAALIGSGRSSAQLGMVVSASGATPFHVAAHEGDVVTVLRLLADGADAESKTRHGVTALALASAGGHSAVVEALLVAGSDPNVSSPEGESPLMVAARTGVVDSVTFLLRHGADVNAREGWLGQTALMWAAAENHAEIVTPIVAADADIDARSDAGFTPLVFAARAGHIRTVKALLDAGADINLSLLDGTSPLVIAVINAHYELASFLLERGADPNADKQGWTALHQLVWTRRPNTSRNNPSALPTGNTTDLQLVEVLVAYGADINARQVKEPQDGYRNMLNRVGATPFLLAAKAVDLELMRLFLKFGADPMLANEDGTTALLVAAGVGVWPNESPGTDKEALEAVQLMLELGDSVATIDDNGDAALHGAVMRGSKELVLYLLDQGAALNPINERGWTPLTIAQGVFYGNLGRRFPDVEVLLIGRGATSPVSPKPPK